MGFRPPKRVYLLDFEGTDLDGLEVRAVAPSLAELMDLARLAESDAGTGLDLMASTFIRHVRSWNLDQEDGTAAPVTAAALLAEGADLALTVIRTWMTAVSEVVGPLDRRSTPGLPDLDLPVETLSRVS